MVESRNNDPIILGERNKPDAPAKGQRFLRCRVRLVWGDVQISVLHRFVIKPSIRRICQMLAWREEVV